MGKAEEEEEGKGESSGEPCHTLLSQNGLLSYSAQLSPVWHGDNQLCAAQWKRK